MAGVLPAAAGWQAYYLWRDWSEHRHVRLEVSPVVGWGLDARGALHALIVPPEANNSELLAVGSADDLAKKHFVVVTGPKEFWEQVPGVDERVRAILRAADAADPDRTTDTKNKSNDDSRTPKKWS